MIEFRTTIPAVTIKPIIEVVLKNARSRAWAARIPSNGNGMAAMIIRGVTKD